MVRIKKRYLCVYFERKSEIRRRGSKRSLLDDPAPLEELSDPVLYGEIRDLVQEFHGDFGVAAAVSSGMRILYVNPMTRICLIQVRHGAHRLVASVIPFLTKIRKEDVLPRLIYTGATVRNCYKVS